MRVDVQGGSRPWRDLIALAAPDLIGFGGNWVAAIIRTRAGKSPRQPGTDRGRQPRRADAYVSLAVIASAVVLALGFPVADPLIGLVITTVIIKITWDSWWTVRGGHHGRSH